MTEATLHIRLPVLLPHVQDERDPCVLRLNEWLLDRKGIEQMRREEAASTQLKGLSGFANGQILFALNSKHHPNTKCSCAAFDRNLRYACA